MKYSLLLIFLLLCNILIAQENIDSNYHIFKYPNGAISSEGTIKDGKPDGYWKSYYVSGVLKSEGKRRNFQLDSVWVFYTQIGDTLEKINYLYGKKSGYYLQYKKDDVYGLYVYSRELYAADLRVGMAYTYFPDGKIKQTLPYIEGKKQGQSKEYDIFGQVITLFEYKNDFLSSRRNINRYDKNNLKQGDWNEYYSDGSIKAEMSYKNKLLHGYYKEYKQNGKLVMAMLYDMGKAVEENTADDPQIEVKNRFDNNGKLTYSGPYKNTIPVGIHREYNANGKVINSKVYNDVGEIISEGIISDEGLKNGRWKYFYSNGTIKEEGTYVNNKRNGLWNFYNKNSKLIQKGSYQNDRFDGRWLWYYEDGNILQKEDYSQGRRDGEFLEYSRSGDLISSGQYVDNERHGEWVYTLGDHREEGKYIIGLRDGVWKYFNVDGKMKYKGKYAQGNAEGAHISYWKNGTVREERYYKTGLKQGKWKKYNSEGILIMTINYKDDVEKRINGVKISLPDSDVKLIK